MFIAKNYGYIIILLLILFIVEIAIGEETIPNILNQNMAINQNVQYRHVDSQLMSSIAGRYYNYSSAGMGTSSGTERHLFLCPNGIFYLFVSSGYSDGGGWNRDSFRTDNYDRYEGEWQVRGNLNRGKIYRRYSNGDEFLKNYQSCGRGCYYIGNTKYGYIGPANCD